MIKRLLVLAAAAALASCSLNKQTIPELAGPSELGLSLAVTATPDIIAQDGRSQSTISVVAHDANAQPVAGLGLDLSVIVNGAVADFGTLSSKTISTGPNGTASVTYFAPAAPPPTATSNTVVTIAVMPVGSDFANATPQSVELQLTRPGVIIPPGNLQNNPPVPKFIFSPTQPKQDDRILFDASSSTDDGRIVSYQWSFGDGNSESDPTPQAVHYYAAPGTYNVILTVTDDGGLSASSAPQQVQVAAADVPTAVFTFSPTQPVVNQLVNFNASASTSPDGHHVVAYDWDFGDGSSHGSGVTPQHIYTVLGTYTVVLDVTDDAGHVGVVSGTITVASATPKAVFTMSPSAGTAPATIQFDGSQSTAQAGNTIVKYQWNFGDGKSGSGVTTSNNYTTSGTFTVQLTVTDSAGATASTTQSITIN